MSLTTFVVTLFLNLCWAQTPVASPNNSSNESSFSAPIPVIQAPEAVNALPPPEPVQANPGEAVEGNTQMIELVNEGKGGTLKGSSTDTQTAPSLTWDPTGKRDPFKPYRAPRLVKQNSDVFVDPLTLLDLSQVQIVAILWNNKNPRAVVKASGTQLYTIFKKTKIGINNGVVAEIREGEVIVVETFDDGFGNIVKEVKPLRLLKPASSPNVDSGRR